MAENIEERKKFPRLTEDIAKDIPKNPQNFVDYSRKLVNALSNMYAQIADMLNGLNENFDGYVAKSFYNAYTILAADVDDTPQPITLAASQLIGRKAAGGIVALAKADLQTIVNVEDGADVTDFTNVNAALATADAAVDFNSQNLTGVGTIGLVGGQIAFPATAVPSADPNTLDDYEEGTFTVTSTASISGTITVSASYNTLSYRKIGGCCFIGGMIDIASVSSPVGSWYIQGLPFTCLNLEENAGRVALSLYMAGLGTSQTVLQARSWPGTNYFEIRGWTGTTEENIADHVKADSSFQPGGWYPVE